MLLLLVLLLISLASALYMWVIIHYNYWSRRNIPQAQTSIFGGNIGKALILKKNLADIYADIYRKYQEYPFVGIYKIFTPTLLVRDPELIKLIILKEFSNFYNNTITLDEADPIAGKNPFVLNGDKWKTVRNQLTPLFTTAKVKSAVAVFNDGGQKLVDYIEKSKGKDDLDGRDVIMRYAIENIASYTLGLEAKSFDNDNSEFKKIAFGLFENSTFQILIFYIAMVFPTLTKYLKIRLASASTEKRFKSIVSHGINYRIENKIVRNDLLSTLISMKTAGTFSDHDISVVIGSFYIDGIETSSTVLNYLLYDLAAHPWAQEELRQEINDVLGENNRTATYEAIQDMKYLDALFNESLRLHTAIPFMDKQTTQNTTLNAKTKDGKPIKVCLKVGTPVIIPLKGLHLDENIFPDPLAFKPERFLPENKDSIPKFAFLPFGEGPRTCLGKVFGTIQVKVGAIHIVRNYRISLGNNTLYCTDINPNAFILRPKNPIRLRFQRW